MAISLEKESKVKTWIGVIVAVGALAYNTPWGTIAQHLPEVLAQLLALGGLGAAATGGSVTKK